jgi:pyridoxamine 5'-phosphate oxidase
LSSRLLRTPHCEKFPRIPFPPARLLGALMRGALPAHRFRSILPRRPAVSRTQAVHIHLTTASRVRPSRYQQSAMSSVGAGEAAPWREDFVKHVQTGAEFQLATVRALRRSPASAATGRGDGEVTYAPRVRTCVYRGMWAALPRNPKNEAQLNPAEVYEATELPTFTTDARMAKVAELLGVEETTSAVGGGGVGASGTGPAPAVSSSGGGAPVEAVWWVVEPKTQWRVQGRAYVLGPDADGESQGARRAVEALQARMRRKKGDHGDASGGDEEGGGKVGQWSFAREVGAHFGNVSPAMRGSFRSPAPGTPRALLPDDSRLGIGQKVTNLDDEVARANFRVVVIVPDEVDRVELNDADGHRRWLYKFVGAGRTEPSMPAGQIRGQWEVVETWP